MTQWKHIESTWKHPDGRVITTARDVKEGDIDWGELEVSLTMAKAGFKQVTHSPTK